MVRHNRLDRLTRRRQRILRSTSILPALFTLSNGLAGFGAIHFATKDALGASTLWHLELSAWLIFVAMVCDMIDGRLARMARRTSDFGGQLDSLCDMVSFGAAPAVLMLRTATMVLRGQIERVSFLETYLGIERVMWCVAGTYLACAALRLARFNVEADPEESSHLSFRGLPSPGAAAAVAALVLLFGHLTETEQGWQSAPWVLAVVGVTLPVITLITALLMVSRLRYPHLVNQYVRGRRPFGYLVRIVLLALAAVWQPYVTLAVVTVLYASWGPIVSAWDLFRPAQKEPPGPVEGEPPTA